MYPGFWVTEQFTRMSAIIYFNLGRSCFEVIAIIVSIFSAHFWLSFWNTEENHKKLESEQTFHLVLAKYKSDRYLPKLYPSFFQ
jgi:hypothetical protein